MSSPTSADWLDCIYSLCQNIKEPIPLEKLVAELNKQDYDANVLLRHAMIHLARAHMSTDKRVERMSAKLTKIRDILDEIDKSQPPVKSGQPAESWPSVYLPGLRLRRADGVEVMVRTSNNETKEALIGSYWYQYGSRHPIGFGPGKFTLEEFLK